MFHDNIHAGAWASPERYIVPARSTMSEREFLNDVFQSLAGSGYYVESLKHDRKTLSAQARITLKDDKSVPDRRFKRRKSLERIAKSQLDANLHMNVSKHRGAFKTKYVITPYNEENATAKDTRSALGTVNNMTIRQSVEKILAGISGFIGD